MNNVDDENILPSTNLSLALGYSNRCIQRILNNDPGAGANAASRLDMTFLATNTLCELVWSPKKGLCLKCTDRSFLNQEPSLLYDLEPIDMASGSSSGKPVSLTNKPMDKEIFMASLAACKFGSEVAGEGNSSIFPSSTAGIIPSGGTGTCGRVEEMKNAVDMILLQKEDPGNNEGEDEFKPDMAQKSPTCEECVAGVKDIGEGTCALGMKTVVAPEIHAAKQCEANESKVQYAECSGRGREKMPSLIDEDRKGKMDNRNLSIIQLENMESTAENDLENPLTEIVALKSADMFDSNTQQDDGLLHEDKTLEVKQSSNSSKFQKGHVNGKAIILADEDGDRMMLNQEDNSRETVESCNSTGQVSTRKRQWNFEQMLIVGNKKFKSQMHESPGSSSRQDSSFMNWISNMTKGFSKSPEGEVPSLRDALSNPDPGLGDADQDFITCNKKKDLVSRNVGFYSIFRSLYSQKRKSQEAVTLNADRETKISEELELENKIYDMNATPIACCMATGNVHKQLLPTSERLNNSILGNRVGPAVNSKNMSMDLAVIKESNSKSTENRNSSNLAADKEKDGTSSNSLGKYKTDSVEKIDSEMPYEGKTAHGFGFKGDPLDSLWVARFTHKASGPFQNPDHWKKGAGEHLDYFADDGMKPKPQLLNLIGSSKENETDEVVKKCSEEMTCVQNCGTAADASLGFYKIKGQDNASSSYKLNHMLPSSRYDSSEAMASVFVRRLDALKHIVPSNDPDKADYATMTCFFCGIKGHHLQGCPEITDTEVEDLLRNFNLYDGVKELSCVCIRCFQLNHWAVDCPSVCKKIRNGPECDTSLANQCGPGIMQLDVSNDDDQKQEVATTDALKACNYSDSGVEKFFSFNWKSNEASTSQKMALDTKLLRKEIASSLGEKRLKENQTRPLYSFINDQISDVPNGVFDAIRSLRLTRTDVLKWINSSLPVSHLEGFFLRLRLGKWEEGLGGTGYYAAYITGVDIESSLEKSKSSISVNVGGMKCLVKSQYVSNHDFLEDELRAWWSATLKGSDWIPSEEELRLKVKEKKRLGL